MGCLLEIDASSQTASMRFTLNGKDMGVAFHGVELAPPTESYTEEMGPKVWFGSCGRCICGQLWGHLLRLCCS